MSIAPLLTVVGAAVGSLATKAVESIQGASFSEMLSAEPDSLEKDKKKEEEALPAPLTSLPKIEGDFKTAAEKDLKEFHRRLVEKLEQAGIEIEQPLTLSVGTDGYVRANPDHPQAEAINELLAGDFNLSNLFRSGVSKMEMVRAFDEHCRFAEVYAKNPELALAQFAHLFASNRQLPQPVMQISGDRMEMTFVD